MTIAALRALLAAAEARDAEERMPPTRTTWDAKAFQGGDWIDEFAEWFAALANHGDALLALAEAADAAEGIAVEAPASVVPTMRMWLVPDEEMRAMRAALRGLLEVTS